MKPPPFDYWAPRSLPEALELMARYGEEAKALAGGQSLVPLMNFRLAAPRQLVDLNPIPELASCAVEDGVLRLGAMVRHRFLERSPVVREHAPLLSMVAPFIGYPQIRARGTIGGSLAHADPAAELPAAVMALDGRVQLRSRTGTRMVAAERFFRSFFTTVAEPDELVVGVEIPLPPPGTAVGFQEVAMRRGDFALAGVAVAVTRGEDGTITRARIACLSAASTPLRVPEAERVLVGEPPSDRLFREVEARVSELVDPPDDVHASAGYRRRTLGVLCRRALTAAVSGKEATRR
ncbi:MAG TPA: xanthine dehydrogenase family protein subunit M [Candidatus Dormibacteraeota bacterium]|nr:xanthine dehydrogenase family protein subunit M [Candidatus Dormibacteraeota bacterium]